MNVPLAKQTGPLLIGAAPFPCAVRLGQLGAAEGDGILTYLIWVTVI